jgi:hypothetical protein
MVEASISLTDPRFSSTTRASRVEGGELGQSGPRSSVDVLSKSSDEWRSTGGLCCSLWLAVSWRGRCWAGLLPIPNTGGTIMTRVYPSPLRVLHGRQTAPLVGTVALSSAPLPLPLPHPSPSSSPPRRRRLPSSPCCGPATAPHLSLVRVKGRPAGHCQPQPSICPPSACSAAASALHLPPPR